MPVAGRTFTKQLELPGYPEDDKAFVTIITNPKADVWEGIDTTDPISSQFTVMARIITDWNFTDEAGQPLPINPETVKTTLAMLDVTLIMDTLGITGLSSAKKNN